MENKKYLGLSLLFLVMGLLLAGCGSQTSDKVSTSENGVKVESDENKVNVSTANNVVIVVKNESAVEKTTDKELITSDDVEIGQLI